MKKILFTSALLGIIAMLSQGADRPRIILHAVKILKVEAYRVFILEDDYGYVVINDGTEKKPKPHYILGSQKDGTVIHYSNKKDFLAAVSNIPSGSTLREYAKCLCPLSYGLTEAQLVYKDIPSLAKAKGIKYSDKCKMYCNCPDSLRKKKQVE